MHWRVCWIEIVGSQRGSACPVIHGRQFRDPTCINELPVREVDRKFHWPLGRRTDEHPDLK
jgi:hypothetical protein